MVGWVGSKTIRIIPDQQGRGGSKTSLSTQSINLDLRLAQNVFVNYGRWRRAPKAIAAPGMASVPNVVDSFALHNYVRFDTANAALGPINRLLSHNSFAGEEQHIDQHNPLATVKTHIPTGGVNDTVPATFQNIKNRCFMCWGGTPNFIYDGIVTYDVGVDAPATAATYTLGGTETGLAASADSGNIHVNWITGTEIGLGFTNDVTSIILNGTLYQTLQPNPLVTTFTSGTCDGTSTTFTVTILGQHWPLGDYYGLQMLIDSGGPKQEQLYILDYTYSGPDTVVTVNAALGFTHTGDAYTLNVILPPQNTQLKLASPYLGDKSTSIAFETFSGPLSWESEPPVYAYAYYDLPIAEVVGNISGAIGTQVLTVNGAHWPPTRYIGMTVTLLPSGDRYTVTSYADSGPDTTVTVAEVLTANYTNVTYTLTGTMKTYGTGHVSDRSPTTMITEKHQAGVSVVLHDIMPSRIEDQARFNKILIFRTVIVGGGGQLYPFDITNPPIGMLDNVGTAPLDFTDTNQDDKLNNIGALQAPEINNRKPLPAAHQAYWDGRVFINPVNDPSAIYFSADSADVLFGVPEECYPSANLLRIPSDDGRVTGMRLMGPLVVITTERYAYYVGGLSASSIPYRLIRFSTLMQGVGDYQMTEFAGSTTDDSDLMLYVGKDKKFYLTAPSVGNVSISDPIQDVFNSTIGADYPGVRVANVAIQGNHYLIVNVGPNAVEYDWDRKIWLNSQAQVSDTAPHIDAFCIVYGTAQPVQFLFIVNGTVYEWLGPNNTVGADGAFIQTMPLSGDRKSRHRLQEVRLYVSDAPAEPWTVEVSVNELAPNSRDAILYPDPLTTIQPPGSFPFDAPNARELMMVPAADDTAVVEGYRFWIKVNWPSNADIQDLYAMDIVLADLEPPDQVSQ